MTTQRRSLRWGLLLSAVVLWTAALSNGQSHPTGITYRRGASPAASAATTIPTQTPMVYHCGPVLADSTTYAYWWVTWLTF